jgi:peptidoglycan/LPS O-acetylase OafA/YrhL
MDSMIEHYDAGAAPAVVSRRAGISSRAGMSAHATYLGTRTFGCLDGLRALSILAVVWHHTEASLPWAGARRGFLGVDLFFVISGFLIVTLLLRERDRRGQISLGAFYVRRSLRIVPLNWSLILALWAGASLSNGIGAATIRHDAPHALLYIANWAPMQSLLAITWSLAAEEQFYLVWPQIERWLRPQVKWLWLALTGVSIGLVCGHAHLGWWPALPTMLAQATFAPILFGVGLAHVLHAPKWFARVQPWLGARWAAPAVALALLAALSVPCADISGLPRLGLQALFMLLVATCVAREDNGLRALLRNRVFVRIGVVSYGIYLLHHIGLYVVHRVVHGVAWWTPALDFVACALVTWGMAELSFRTLERFFLGLKDRWAR